MTVTSHLKRYHQKRNGKKTNRSSSDLAPNWGLPSQRLTTLLVRSYRTFAPLPTLVVTKTGGIFLWHYPHDRSHWALPSKFGLSGVRTFLRLSRVRNRLRSLLTHHIHSSLRVYILIDNELSR